jgi:glucan endo-1,3-alpha-glucosidase
MLTHWTPKKDEVVFWYRVYPKNIVCSAGTLPRNSDFPADAVFALAMLTSPSTVQLSIGSNTVNMSVPAGLTMGSVDFPKEDHQTPYVALYRNGTLVADVHGSKYVDQTGCTYYNFNPFVAALTT